MDLFRLVYVWVNVHDQYLQLSDIDFQTLIFVHGLRGRDVLYSIRGLSKLDMQRLSVSLQLACGELSFGELHLQCRLYGARWKHVHSVRGRQVQGVNRIGRVHGLRCRDVLYSSRGLSPVHKLWSRDVFHSRRGLSKLDMHRLSVELLLACGERSFDQLHLQRRLLYKSRC